MKFFLFSFLFVFLLLGESFAANDVSALIHTYRIGETPMYEQVQLQDLLKDLGKVGCSSSSLQAAKSRFTAIKRRFDRNYKKAADYKKLSLTKKQFESYQVLVSQLQDSQKLQDLCQEVSVYAQFMDYVRDLHVAILEKTGIMKDFETISIQDLYGGPIKIAILKDAVSKLSSYENTLGISFSLGNTALVSKETGEKKEIIDLLTMLMQKTILKNLSDLKSKQLLSDTDIQQFQNKITLEYVNSCSNFHGSYKMKEVYTSSRVLVSQQVDNMKILVNVCYNYHILQDIGTLFEKIVLHELGHHMYYQKDRDHSIFEGICWVDSKTKKKECGKDSFITNYASSSSLEDYAEQFMHSYLGISKNFTSKIKEKDEYFLKKFPVLKMKK